MSGEVSYADWAAMQLRRAGEEITSLRAQLDACRPPADYVSAPRHLVEHIRDLLAGAEVRDEAVLSVIDELLRNAR